MALRSLMLDATIENIRHSLQRHMPISHQRDFYLWGISSANPLQDTFLYAMSVTQLINLAAFLLEDLVAPEYWSKLARYAGRLNTYFMYEIVSDDLAIGLAPLASADTTYPLRREILYAFNYGMVERLTGEPMHSAQILEPLENFSRSISGFTQSMTREKHGFVLRSYLQQHPEVQPVEIEYAIWPVLVANVELCRELAESMDRLQMGGMIRQGFIDRYQAVTELLERQGYVNLSELTDIGARSILVTATLAYFTGVLAEVIEPQERLNAIIQDGTMWDAVSTSALLVRLLNDVGIPLILPAEEREALIAGLWQHHINHPETTATIAQLLLSAAEDNQPLAGYETNSLLTRFQKDISAGEFNTCLHNLAYANTLGEALEMLEENLAYFGQVYQEAQQHLQQQLAVIQARLKMSTVSVLMSRFVQFYAMLYAKPYKTSSGEYVA